MDYFTLLVSKVKFQTKCPAFLDVSPLLSGTCKGELNGGGAGSTNVQNLCALGAYMQYVSSLWTMEGWIS